MDLTDWLTQHGLREYEEVLRSEGFEDLDDLADLTEADLRELGLKMAHAKRLLKALREGSVETGATAGNTSASPVNPVALPRADLAAARTLRLFLSYGRDDHAVEVKALRDALRARGHEVWFDEEQLGTGLDWEQRIEAGLAWCDRVVLTMTPHSVRRPDGYCLNEIAKALELRKLIIPVLLVEVPQGAPTSICRIQYLDWRDAVPAAEKAERFTQRLARLCEAIEEDKLDFEGGQQRLIRHLQPLNFDGDIQRHVASFRGRVQLEARLRQWLADPQGSQVLWLTAAPGLGKSALAATLAHRWAEVGAVHFCVAGHQDKANPASAVLSIAYQLSQRLDVYRELLANLELERETQKDSRTLFDTLLVGPLAKNYPAPPIPLVVILDGLDEATQAGGENPLAEIVAADWGRLPAWLRLMVSSRPEAELVTWLAGTQRIEIRGDGTEQRADLQAFLRDRLTAIGRPPGEETLSRILERSEGAFHYAVLLIEEVRQGRCDPDNPVDLPAGLNPFYLQTFKRRFPDITAYRSQTRPLLELILAAPEPIPLAVLAGATKREAQDVRQDLSALGSMLAIEPGPGETDPDWDKVRLSHASLRSWLTGLDATRQPLAGAFAAKVNTQGLAAEVLRLWEAGNDPSKEVQDAGIERRGFVARTLWGLVKGTSDEASMQRVAFDLSLYWEKRKLALAIESGEFAAERAWRGFEAGLEEPVALKRSRSCLKHVGDLHSALGRSTSALTSFRRALTIAERLAAQNPDNAGWQRDLSASYNKVGGALEAQGNLAGALEEFRKGLAIAERLAAQDPDNAGWQRGLSASYNRVGGVLEAQGNLAGALEEFRKYHAIMERLAARDPDNAGWQRDLSVSYNKVGDVLKAQGNLAGALEEFRKCQAIRERLAAQDPDNAGWQRELSVSYSRVGDVLEAQGNLAGALEEFRKYHAIMERLAARDPDNAGWQRDLSVSYNKVGDVLKAQGNLAGALEEFRKCQAIRERLAAQDPDNAGWQRELSVSYSRVGDVLEAQGNLAGALEEFRKYHAIMERLAARDPDNAGWQRDLSVSYNKVGDVLKAQGNLAGALEEFRKCQAIRERLAAQDPDNAGWQRELSVSYSRVGDVLEAQGNLAGALEGFRKALEIKERLAAQDPDNAGWQRDLSVNYNKVGGVLKAQGNLAGALTSFRRALTIAERLAAQDPDNAGWQSDLSASYNRVGGVLKAQGNLAGALKEFRKCQAIMERLAAQDPDNAGWQRNSSVDYNSVGGVLKAQGNLAGALEEFRKAREIRERLAAQDPDNAGWQRDLSYSYNRVGDVLEAQGNLAGALEEFLKALEIRERLAAQDPDNAGWQRDLSVNYNSVGGVLQVVGDHVGACESFGHYLQLSQGILEADPGNSTKQRNVAIGHASVAAAQLALKRVEDAQSSYALARPMLQALRDVEDPGAEFDWAAITALGAEIALVEGDAECAASHRQELAGIDLEPEGLAGIELEPEGLAGRFRKRFLPLILQHLEATTQDGDPNHRALVTLRVLRLDAKAPAIDLSTWRERARELLQQLQYEESLAAELRGLVP